MSRLATDVDALQPQARQVLGTGVETRSIRSLAAVIGQSGTGWYLILALSLFAGLDEASAYILSAVGPDVGRGLGLSPSAFGEISAQRQAFVGLLALQFAYFFYRREHRALLAKSFAVQYGFSFILASLVTWSPLFVPVVGVVGTGGALVYASHRPMLVDAYHPEARMRALSVHRVGGVVGAIAGPGLVAALAGPLHLSWRGILIVSGALLLLLSLFGLRLRDPGYGHFDTDEIAKLPHADAETVPASAGDPTEMRFGEILRRVWLVPSVRRLLWAWAVLGVAVAPLLSYQGFLLQVNFNLTTGGRAAFYAAAWSFAVPALWFVGRRGELTWRRDPPRLLKLTAIALVILAAGLGIAVVPVLGISLVGFGVVFAAEAVAVPALTLALLSVVRPRARPAAAALSAVFFALVGGEGGALVLGSLASRFSVSVAIGVLMLPALGAAWLLVRASRFLDADLDRVVDEVIEDEDIRVLAGAGVEVPLLACRGIDFSYGPLQVLFDIDFTVTTGEMVALLGVNGAGKSTLLKVISGICIPWSGSVRLDGSDITYLDAERRVGIGISHIAGGRDVFGPLSVVDNLRGIGYSIGRDRRRIEDGIEECFDAFPRLRERRNQLASTLSGGEQQMLALSKALLLKPRLLLIDELSLGLAPVIVAQLLEMVRRINASGTAVVLVEQSVSVALNLVEHAYFMEKGEIRFDGRASDLLSRDDLLRAVFLEGATAGGDR